VLPIGFHIFVLAAALVIPRQSKMCLTCMAWNGLPKYGCIVNGGIAKIMKVLIRTIIDPLAMLHNCFHVPLCLPTAISGSNII
jgi:hypothetical protein